jgi:hypothetical protein
MRSSENYRVTVWDTQQDMPYYILKYGELEEAQRVARTMKRHYVDDWSDDGWTPYEVRLQRMPQEA